MVKRVFHYLWSSRRQIIKYFLVGVSGVVLDIGTLWFFKEHLGWRPVFAVIVNQTFLLVYNFNLNKYWSFRNRAMPHKQIVRYLSLASFNYAFAIGFMYLGHDILGVHYLLTRLLSIAFMVSWNFVLYQKWVYRSDSSEPIANSQ